MMVESRQEDWSISSQPDTVGLVMGTLKGHELSCPHLIT